MHSVTRPGLGLNIPFYSMIWLGNPKWAPFWIPCCSLVVLNVYDENTWFVVVVTVMETRSVFVLATVVSIRDKFCYPCCTRCRKKVHTIEDDVTWVKLVFSCSCSNKIIRWKIFKILAVTGRWVARIYGELEVAIKTSMLSFSGFGPLFSRVDIW